jgi:hypothetical protein
MRPHPNAPVWPMDAFRDRFLTAYGPQPPSVSPSAPPAKHQRNHAAVSADLVGNTPL